MPKKESAASKMKRGESMVKTASEGANFLKDVGHQAHNKDEVETRSRAQTREAADIMMGQQETKKVTEMTPDEINKEKDKIRMVFRLFDTNKDGKIDEEELTAVINGLGKRPTVAKIRKVFQEADKNKDGSIQSEEFVEYMINKRKLKEKKRGGRGQNDQESQRIPQGERNSQSLQEAKGKGRT